MRYFSVIVAMVIAFSACNNSASPANSGLRQTDTVGIVGTYLEREQNYKLFLNGLNEPSFDTITEMGKHYYRVFWKYDWQPKLRMLRLVVEGDSVHLVYKTQYLNEDKSVVVVDTVFDSYVPSSFGNNFFDYLDSAKFEAMPQNTGVFYTDADLVSIESAYVFINPAFVDSRDFRKVHKVQRYLGEDKAFTDAAALLFQQLDSLVAH